MVQVFVILIVVLILATAALINAWNKDRDDGIGYSLIIIIITAMALCIMGKSLFLNIY